MLAYPEEEKKEQEVEGEIESGGTINQVTNTDAADGIVSIKQGLAQIDEDFDAKIEAMKNEEYAKIKPLKDDSVPTVNEIEREAAESVAQSIKEEKEEFLEKFNYDQ